MWKEWKFHLDDTVLINSSAEGAEAAVKLINGSRVKLQKVLFVVVVVVVVLRGDTN